MLRGVVRPWIVADPPRLRSKQRDRLRMAQRDPRVLADDMLAEHHPGGGIGDDDAVVVEQQQRQAELLDHVAHPVAGQLDAVGLGHRGLLDRARDPQRGDPQQQHRGNQPEIGSGDIDAHAGGERDRDAGQGKRAEVHARSGLAARGAHRQRDHLLVTSALWKLAAMVTPTGIEPVFQP